MQNLQSKAALIIRLSSEILPDLCLFKGILHLEQILSYVNSIVRINMTTLPGVRDTRRRFLIESQNYSRLLLPSAFLRIEHLNKGAVAVAVAGAIGVDVDSGRRSGAVQILVAPTSRDSAACSCAILVVATTSRNSTDCYGCNDATVQTLQHCPNSLHRIQAQFAVLLSRSFGTGGSSSSNQRESRSTGPVHVVGDADLSNPSQGVDYALEQINGTQVTVIIEKDLSQSGLIGTDLFKESDDQ
mmetsp:Transcript_20627/g.42064  ORF Transcript_20627/g.42064 Transcript_20627/m.42064 type:complete len:243 (-) Transcript_20627:1005-1733(-)